MPIVGGKYKNPGWVNNQKPAIGATELNAISATVEKLDAGGGDAVTSFKGRTGAVTPQAGDYTAEMVGAVPTFRTVNGKPLTGNIALTAADVGTVPITYGTTDLTPGSSPLATGSVYLVYE